MERLARHEVALSENGVGGTAAMLDGADVSSELFTPEVSQATSIAARHPQVRSYLIAAQRSAFPGRSLVAEGRDIGTVIFPDAPLKFFVQADEAIRVERRLSQLTGDAVEGGDRKLTARELEELKAKLSMEISERDRRDSERAASPTKPAENAILIDNSREPLTEVVDRMYDFAAKGGLLTPV